MAMTTTEQNTLNQLLNTAKTNTQMKYYDNIYILVGMVPLQVMTSAQALAFAQAYGGTIASP